MSHDYSEDQLIQKSAAELLEKELGSQCHFYATDDSRARQVQEGVVSSR